MAWTVSYTCRHWAGKADPNGFGRCSIAYSEYAPAQEKAMQLKAKGHANIRIDKTAP